AFCREVHLRRARAEVAEIIHSFFPHNAAFTGGVLVAAGDRIGDGHDEFVTEPDSTGGPDVKIFFDTDGEGQLSDNTTDEFSAFGSFTRQDSSHKHSAEKAGIKREEASQWREICAAKGFDVWPAPGAGSGNDVRYSIPIDIPRRDGDATGEA